MRPKGEAHGSGRIRRGARAVWIVTALATAQLAAANVATAGCPGRGMARVGPGCMDKYEASVWRIPPTATELVQAVRTRKPTAEELIAGGARQLGVVQDDYGPCSDDGSACDDVYAVSTPGVRPSTHLTWFQAQQACGNARKRLPRNAEWQMAAAGTPDRTLDDGATTCVLGGAGDVIATGTRSACVSRWGVFDMSTNVFEWTEDWVPRSTVCTGWADRSPAYMCLAGAETRSPFPGVIVRGGSWEEGGFGGTLTIDGSYSPFSANGVIGFRCAS